MHVAAWIMFLVRGKCDKCGKNVTSKPGHHEKRRLGRIVLRDLGRQLGPDVWNGGRAAESRTKCHGSMLAPTKCHCKKLARTKCHSVLLSSIGSNGSALEVGSNGSALEVGSAVLLSPCKGAAKEVGNAVELPSTKCHV